MTISKLCQGSRYTYNTITNVRFTTNISLMWSKSCCGHCMNLKTIIFKTIIIIMAGAIIYPKLKYIKDCLICCGKHALRDDAMIFLFAIVNPKVINWGEVSPNGLLYLLLISLFVTNAALTRQKKNRP